MAGSQTITSKGGEPSQPVSGPLRTNVIILSAAPARLQPDPTRVGIGEAARQHELEQRHPAKERGHGQQ